MDKFTCLFKIFSPISKCWNFIWNYRATERWRELKNVAYSSWVQNEFGTAGALNIAPPITLKNQKNINLGNNVKIGSHGVLTAWAGTNSIIGTINIGDNCNFGENLNITASNSIQIGNNVLTGRWVTITDNNHGGSDKNELSHPPLSRSLCSKGPINIGDNVWIGDKVTILSNVKIGTGSIIAANSVVTKDIPPYSVAAGCPARVVKSV